MTEVLILVGLWLICGLIAYSLEMARARHEKEKLTFADRRLLLIIELIFGPIALQGYFDNHKFHGFWF